MTPDDVLIAIGREVCAELALYGKLHDLRALSASGEAWRTMMEELVERATDEEETDEP